MSTLWHYISRGKSFDRILVFIEDLQITAQYRLVETFLNYLQ